MRVSVVIVGTVIALMRLVFWLQGLAFVGPQSSFMYKNPEWIANGLYILVLGIAVIIAGVMIGRSKVSF